MVPLDLKQYASRTGVAKLSLLLAKVSLGQAEQHRTLSVVHKCSCSYSTVQLPGASLASADVLLTHFEKLLTYRQTDRKIDGWQTAVFIELLPQLKIR